MSIKEDDIYNRPYGKVAPFEFNEQVVEVFDDMLSRSVPLYAESIRRQAQLAERFYRQGTRIYDLGCSNGNLGLSLGKQMGSQVFKMVAVDNSQPMLDTYKQRLAGLDCKNQVELRCADMREVELEGASVIILNLTLQFLPVADRDAFIGKIYDALLPGGVFLLTEKVVHGEDDLADLQRDFYYRFKRENGYSELEISQKRDALENVLVPETLEQHFDRLRGAGFKSWDVWLKWFNFAAILARK